MSYIIQGTTYPNPDLSITSMDLIDLKNIYSKIISNYLLTDYNAQLYNYQTKDVAIKEYKYQEDSIINIICYQYDNNNSLVSVVPLFFYLSCITKNWTEEQENLQTFIQEYLNTYNQGDLKTLLETFSKNLSFENFPGLAKFKEYILKKDEEYLLNYPDGKLQTPVTANSSLLDWFLFFWQNNCYFNIEIPNKTTIVKNPDLNFNTDQQQRYDTIYKMFESNPDKYTIYPNGSVYDNIRQIWIVGGVN